MSHPLTLPSQPAPVPGAASYWAEHNLVMMRDTNGYVSDIQIARTPGAALDAACRWQMKENKAVEKEAKRLATLTTV